MANFSTALPAPAGRTSVALEACLPFGKGRHPAALNSGDHCADAIASIAGEPLLCPADGFAKTDPLPGQPRYR